MDDGNGYSPEDLKRLGLGGRGHIRLPRSTGVAAFFRSFRPPWPGLPWTLVMGVFLVIPKIAPAYWVNRNSGWTDYSSGFSWNWLRGSVLGGLLHPMHTIRAATVAPYAAGGALALVFTLITGAVLVWGGGSRFRRPLGFLFVAAGFAAIAWAVVPKIPAGSIGFGSLVFPGAAGYLGAVVLGTHLLFRYARRQSSRRSLLEAAPDLAVVALIGMNLGLLNADPSLSWRMLIRGPGALPPVMFAVFRSPILPYTGIVGFPALFLLGFVAGEGMSFGRAAKTLLRVVRCRPLPALLSLLSFFLLALVPSWDLGVSIGAAAGLKGMSQSIGPILLGGFKLGAFAYLVALVARGIVASLPPDPAPASVE